MAHLISRYETVQFSDLCYFVRFWHETMRHADLRTMLLVANRLVSHPSEFRGFPRKFTPAIIRKYFPVTCHSCPLCERKLKKIMKDANHEITSRHPTMEGALLGNELIPFEMIPELTNPENFVEKTIISSMISLRVKEEAERANYHNKSTHFGMVSYKSRRLHPLTSGRLQSQTLER